MKAINSIFQSSIREKKEKNSSEILIKDLVFELAYKKIQKVKNQPQIQKIVGNLYDTFIQTLKDEELYSHENILEVINGLLKATNYDEEMKIYEKFYEKEKIEKEIEKSSKNLQQNISLAYENFEKISSDESAKKALNEAKLNGIYIHGILKEVTTEALITTIEKGSDIEETSANIVKNFVYQALRVGDFRKDRFSTITKTVLDAAIELADVDPSSAKDVIKGSIYGARDGILKAVEAYKNDIKFAPDDNEFLSEYDLNEAKKELNSIENDFIGMLYQYAQKTDKNSGLIINDMLKKELDSTFAKINRLTNETKDTLNERIGFLKQNASQKLEQFKQNAEEFEKIASQKVEELKQNNHTSQAKELGEKAWEKAKEIAKNAKEVINKK